MRPSRGWGTAAGVVDSGPMDTLKHRRTPRTKQPTATLRTVFRPDEGIVDEVARTIEQGATTLGRGDDADWSHPGDPRMSGRHATLSCSKSGVVTVQDHSSNGTYMAGTAIGHVELRDGDVLRCGDTFFVFRYEEPDISDGDIPALFGRAPAMRRLRSEIERAAPSELSVLVLGESGTGKELVARAMHLFGTRSGPFVAVNCSAIPNNLAESQLFGHREGAFTGAVGEHRGYFQQAHGGTLFLDEVGDLGPEIQPKLLRVLEDKAVVPLGGGRAERFDARIVAATNLDLRARRGRGEFRGDLLARLSEFVVRCPPLRERKEDLLLLFAAHYSGKATLHPDAVEALLCHGWPFNVREVIAMAKELSVRAGRSIDLAMIEPRLALMRSEDEDPTEPLDTAEEPTEEANKPPPPDRHRLHELLTRHGGNISRVAKETGRSRRQVYRWAEELGLDPDDYREEG